VRNKAMKRHSTGQSIVEFIIVFPVLMILIFGTIQIAFIYSANTTLNYATFQAARMGALNGATYDGIKKGLVRGLAPLYTHGATDDDMAAGVARALFEVENYVLITRINPRIAHFTPHAHAQYDTEVFDWVIPNDNLMYRDQSVGEISIQDANLLKIQVEYCYPLMVPIVDRFLAEIDQATQLQKDANVLVEASRAVKDDYDDICGDRASSNSGFIVTSEAIVRMQSAAQKADEDCSKTEFSCR